METQSKIADFFRLASRIGEVYTRRLLQGQQAFASHLQAATEKLIRPLEGQPQSAGQAAPDYLVDCLQRWVLFWDTLRQRGNAFLEHERANKPPLLDYDYQMVVDGRTLARPVNYALVRIVPPAGVAVDDRKRPYVIID